MKKTKIYLLLGVFSVLVVSSIFMTIENATSSLEVSKLQDEETQLTSQKRDLEQNLVKTISFGSLSEKSAEMGYSSPTDLVYVTPSAPVAKLP